MTKAPSASAAPPGAGTKGTGKGQDATHLRQAAVVRHPAAASAEVASPSGAEPVHGQPGPDPAAALRATAAGEGLQDALDELLRYCGVSYASTLHPSAGTSRLGTSRYYRTGTSRYKKVPARTKTLKYL